MHTILWHVSWINTNLKALPTLPKHVTLIECNISNVLAIFFMDIQKLLFVASEQWIFENHETRPYKFIKVQSLKAWGRGIGHQNPPIFPHSIFIFRVFRKKGGIQNPVPMKQELRKGILRCIEDLDRVEIQKATTNSVQKRIYYFVYDFVISIVLVLCYFLFSIFSMIWLHFLQVLAIIRSRPFKLNNFVRT